jgi:hypothetical protein
MKCGMALLLLRRVPMDGQPIAGEGVRAPAHDDRAPLVPLLQDVFRVRRGGEPVGSPRAARQPAGRQRIDPGRVHQGAARRLDRLSQLLGVRRQLRFEPAKFGDRIIGQSLADRLDWSGRTDATQQSRCLGGRQSHGCTAGQ